MYAVVNTGGKQLKVAVGDTVSVEKLDEAPGAVVKFDALLVSDGDKIMVGDEAAAIAITGEVLGHGKADKVIVFKFKKRKGYKKLRGHRQPLTLVKITDIGLVGAKPKAADEKAEDKGRRQGRLRPRPGQEACGRQGLRSREGRHGCRGQEARGQEARGQEADKEARGQAAPRRSPPPRSRQRSKARSRPSRAARNEGQG